MLSRQRFMEIAQEGLDNPRTGHYTVHPLHNVPRAYPFRTEADEAVPAVVWQFAVENVHDVRARRVVTISRYKDGYALWCGDRFTEGRLDELGLDAQELIESAIHQIPAHNATDALADMHAVEGAYPFHAPCHFWRAWQSHQGVCKHVAAAIQSVNASAGGLSGMLDRLDESYDALMAEAVDLELPGADALDKQRARGDLVTLVAKLAAAAGGIPPEQYVLLHALLDVIEG